MKEKTEQIEKVSDAKSWSFEKSDKINKSVARQIKKRE